MKFRLPHLPCSGCLVGEGCLGRGRDGGELPPSSTIATASCTSTLYIGISRPHVPFSSTNSNTHPHSSLTPTHTPHLIRTHLLFAVQSHHYPHQPHPPSPSHTLPQPSTLPSPPPHNPPSLPHPLHPNHPHILHPSTHIPTSHHPSTPSSPPLTRQSQCLQ